MPTAAQNAAIATLQRALTSQIEQVRKNYRDAVASNQVQNQNQIHLLTGQHNATLTQLRSVRPVNQRAIDQENAAFNAQVRADNQAMQAANAGLAQARDRNIAALQAQFRLDRQNILSPAGATLGAGVVVAPSHSPPAINNLTTSPAITSMVAGGTIPHPADVTPLANAANATAPTLTTTLNGSAPNFLTSLATQSPGAANYQLTPANSGTIGNLPPANSLSTVSAQTQSPISGSGSGSSILGTIGNIAAGILGNIAGPSGAGQTTGITGGTFGVGPGGTGAGAAAPAKDNTLLYLAIGGAALALFLILKKK